MENSLAPAFVKVDYASAYGSHVMTIPSVPIDLSFSGGGSVGFDLRGGALSVNADTAIKDYIAIVKKFFPSSTTFTGYTIYAQSTPEAAPTPVQAGSIGVVGTNAGAFWSKAVQLTWTFRADDFGLFKIVLLDALSFGNNYDRVTALGGTTLELSDYVTADTTWLASRSGGRPDVFMQISSTLNEALRKRYNMT